MGGNNTSTLSLFFIGYIRYHSTQTLTLTITPTLGSDQCLDVVAYEGPRLIWPARDAVPGNTLKDAVGVLFNLYGI